MVHMDDIRSPIYAAEPYQESQGGESPAAASPAELAAFYKDMEQKEIVERKLSKRKPNTSTPLWSRKSVKRSATARSVPPPTQEQPSYENRSGEVEEREAAKPEEQTEKLDGTPQMNSPRSIIPDTMKDFPTKDVWASVPLPANRFKCNIHNPVGPRWYKNHHLIPPSQTRPAARPPSVFSPFFPPMASSLSMQERSEDTTRLAGPSRTPSNSPLPTPDSSQTRVADGGKPRSRKTSQTAHDNVDLLDATDPWGTNWHHHSPYDIGLGNGPVSIDVQEALNTRSRRSSMTTQTRRKTVTPSPLSQSTSAIHLHTQAPNDTIHLPRKLSKRRTPAVGSIFGGQTQEPTRNAVSLPTTPVEHVPQAPEISQGSDLPKRMSVAPIAGSLSVSQVQPTSKKEKRGSVLGRLVKKLSLMRKPALDQRILGKEDDRQRFSINNDGIQQQSSTLEKQVVPEKPQPDITKRIPPPSMDHASSMKHDESPQEPDRSSSISLEAPFSIGKLTITNPDAPDPNDNTPIPISTPLPPDTLNHNGDSYTSFIYEVRPPNPNSQVQTSPQTPISVNPHIPQPVVQPRVIAEKNSLLPTTKDKGGGDAITISSTGALGRPGSSESQSLQPAALPLNHPNRTSVHEPPESPNKPLVRTSRASASRKRAHSTELNTYHRTEKPQPAPPAPPAKVVPSSSPPSLPFPTTGSANGHFMSGDGMYSYENSPLSAASMLANPPTPYGVDISIPPTPEQPPPSLPSRAPQERKLSSYENSLNNSTMSRQTETFKLVRSSSGNVYASSETIVAGGEQWEVIESLDNKGKSKTPPKSKEQQKSEGKTRVNTSSESEQHHRTQSRTRKLQSGERSSERFSATTGKANARGTSLDHTETEAVESRPNTTRASRKRDEERKSERKSAEKVLNVNKPQPPPPPPTPGAPSRPLQRNPSISARPTSELPSAAEMNAMRAKEAWEMERLWKARSMYGDEPNGFTDASAPDNPPLKSDKSSNHDGAHGSSHTAFIVQTPFQSQPSRIYHSMPIAPPPIIYASSPPISHSLHNSISPHSQTNQIFSPGSSDRKSVLSTSRTLANPLPEPPRESSYEPTPLSPAILDPGTERSSDYWSKLTGVATLH